MVIFYFIQYSDFLSLFKSTFKNLLKIMKLKNEFEGWNYGVAC